MEHSATRAEGPRALRPDEHSSAITLLNLCLRPNGPSTILQEYPRVLGIDNLDNMRVIVKDGKVISHAAIYPSRLRSGELVFNVGGINSVATHPAHRGRGLASAVMENCIGIMEAAGCHISVLWTQRQTFYRKLGYEAAGADFRFRVTTAALGRISPECRVVPYSPEHLPSLIEIHEREILRTERSEEEYETYLGLPKANTLLAVSEGRVTAYAVMGKGEDLQYCVHDWGGDPRHLLCLIRELASCTGTRELLVLSPAQESEFARLLEQIGAQRLTDYLAMIRIIDINAVSALLGEYVQTRIGRKFGIARGDSGTTIRVGDAEAIVPTEGTLVRVLFGPGSASHLLQGLPAETTTLLDRAFPLPLFIWGLDSV